MSKLIAHGVGFGGHDLIIEVRLGLNRFGWVVNVYE